MSETTHPIEDMEGIGGTYGDRLRTAGVVTTADLLEKAGQRKGRVGLAAETEISEKLILTRANVADIMRISGVGRQTPRSSKKMQAWVGRRSSGLETL